MAEAVNIPKKPPLLDQYLIVVYSVRANSNAQNMMFPRFGNFLSSISLYNTKFLYGRRKANKSHKNKLVAVGYLDVDVQGEPEGISGNNNRLGCSFLFLAGK